MKSKRLLIVLISILFLGSCNLLDDESNEEGYYSVGTEINIDYEVITDDVNMPWQMDFTDDGRIFLTERVGRVRIVENGKLLQKPWLAIEDSVEMPDGQDLDRAGLQGIALDPDFENNGYVYIGYAYYNNENPDLDKNRLVRYIHDEETNTGKFDKVLIEGIIGDNLHNAARIKFGPDEKIYWSVGDAFIPERAQDLNNYSGKILRINADGTIPDDNPFPGSYIYSYGHRNPQGFDWNPKNGDMFATEHGPSSGQGCCNDEINLIKPGNNYGWPIIRGMQKREGLETPIIDTGVPQGEYDYFDTQDYTWAPSGAVFIKSGVWKGVYLVAALRQYLVQIAFDDDYNVVEINKFFEREKNNPDYFGRIRSVNQAPDGSIYMITSNKGRLSVLGETDFIVKINVTEVESN
jgi:glucose/arabinose dehydrogenase